MSRFICETISVKKQCSSILNLPNPSIIILSYVNSVGIGN